MMCKIKSCAGLHLFKAAILCSQRNYSNDIDPLPPPCREDWKWRGWVPWGLWAVGLEACGSLWQLRDNSGCLHSQEACREAD